MTSFALIVAQVVAEGNMEQRQKLMTKQTGVRTVPVVNIQKTKVLNQMTDVKDVPAGDGVQLLV